MRLWSLAEICFILRGPLQESLQEADPSQVKPVSQSPSNPDTVTGLGGRRAAGRSGPNPCGRWRQAPGSGYWTSVLTRNRDWGTVHVVMVARPCCTPTEPVTGPHIRFTPESCGTLLQGNARTRRLGDGVPRSALGSQAAIIRFISI